MIGYVIESLLEAIDKILSAGHFSWGAVITALLFFNKIQRNKEFRLRDQRVERNQQRIMAKLGVEGEWNVERPRLSVNGVYLLLIRPWAALFRVLSTMLFIRRKGIDKSILSRRKNMITNFLKSIFTANLSKKLVSALVSMGIAALNSKYGWNIPEPVVYGILGLSAAHISLQTIIDSIKANAIAKVTTTVTEIKSIDVSKLSYNDMIPYINNVNNTLTQCFEDMRSGKVTDATKDAMDLYLKVHAVIEANKTPGDIPSVTGIGA